MNIYIFIYILSLRLVEVEAVFHCHDDHLLYTVQVLTNIFYVHHLKLPCVCVCMCMLFVKVSFPLKAEGTKQIGCKNFVSSIYCTNSIPLIQL